MKDKEKQIEKIETIIKSNLAEGSFANAFARKVAIQIIEHYQPKLPEDSVVLSKEELHEIEENAYQVGVATGKQVGSKETAEKIFDRIDENTCYFSFENTNKEYREGYAQAISDFIGRILEIKKELGIKGE